MKRNMGLMLAALLGSTPTIAAENNWDSYIAAQLSPNHTVAKTAVGTIDRRARDITMVLVAARKHWNELSPETQALARGWMARPDVGGGDNSSFGPVAMDAASETPVNTTHFRVHYIDCSGHRNDADCATASYISAVKTALEKVWATEIGTRGYQAPPSDGALGGDALYDVYVAEIGSLGIYGYASAEQDATTSYSYLVIDNDYDGFGYSDPTVPMKVTVAHEFFHAVQFGYDSKEDRALMENSSTWMETVVYPTIHDNYQYLGEPYTDSNGNGLYNRGELFTDRNGNRTRNEGSMDFPEAPLDNFDHPALIQYGRWLWPQYLTEKFDADVMRHVWESAAAAGDNHFGAMDAALVLEGSSLATAYHEYATWGYDTHKYADGANYPRVWVDGVANGKATLRSSTTYSLGGGTQGHMSTVYERINNPNGAYTFSSSNGTPRLTMLEVDSSCHITPTDVALDPASGDGTWTAAAGTRFAVAVISNASSSDNTMSWALTGGAANTASVPACAITVKDGTTGGSSGGGGGGGALDLLALSIAGLLYARRRLA